MTPAGASNVPPKQCVGGHLGTPQQGWGVYTQPSNAIGLSLTVTVEAKGAVSTPPGLICLQLLLFLPFYTIIGPLVTVSIPVVVLM